VEGAQGWIIVILVGGIIGWVASLIMKTGEQMGLIANVLVGIGGSLLGHWLAPKLGITKGSLPAWFGICLGGAVLLIIILRFLGIFS
jgi:uncharacterized membrane protein YeaQ/YmgE (transglycosylase-associated protein family)